MLKLNTSKMIIFLLMLLCIVLSFVLFNENSFAIKEEYNDAKMNNKASINDDNIFDFLANTKNRMDVYDLTSEMSNIIFVSPKVAKEDPTLEIKKNNAEKGIAKETTAKKAIEKYETNETSLGIDVSTWQGTIDWKQVKESGINFAMIRCGFRGMDSGKITIDDRFLDNIKGATANNINVGVYFFSMAKNETEAIEEAKWVVNLIKDYDISYPVAIDTEIFNKYRLTGVSYSTLTDNAIAFCKYIKQSGYTPMIYSYLNAFNKYFDTAKFEPYRVWLAHYTDETSYSGRYYMWQYTSSGSVPGIKGRVDMDVSYFSVTNDATKRSIVNGIYKTNDLEDIEFKKVDIYTTLTKDSALRISPYTTLPNKAGSLNKGTNVTITGLGRKWIRIMYENNTYYINDINCFNLILEEVLFEPVDWIAKVTDSVKVLYKPYDFLFDNEFITLNVDDEINIVGVNTEYVEVLIEDVKYYINNVDFFEILEDKDYFGSSEEGQDEN